MPEDKQPVTRYFLTVGGVKNTEITAEQFLMSYKASPTYALLKKKAVMLHGMKRREALDEVELAHDFKNNQLGGIIEITNE